MLQRIKHAGITIVFFGIAAGVPNTTEAKPPERPNILWVSCEDMSPFIGPYGDSFATTPGLDRFAREGAIRFNHAWSTMPICAPARSTLITGRYATALGTMNLRSQVPIPGHVQPFPVLLRKAGYFCTNNRKTDYNFSAEGIWDENSADAHWSHRPDRDQPFFHVVNYTSTHEGHTQRYWEKTPGIHHDPERVPLPPYFPDTPTMRAILAHHYDLISGLDTFFGKVMAELEADGLADDTIVFFFSDHGSGLPRYKRWLYETGLRVPLLIHIPEKWSHLRGDLGSETDRLVGFVDFAPTVLRLAGVDIPENMQGHAFLGETVEEASFRYLFGSRDRADDLEDLSRCVRDDRYLYIRHYLPHRPYMRDAIIFSDSKSSAAVLHEEMEQSDPKSEVVKMFTAKPHEELYDLQEDPHELRNLAARPEYAAVKDRLSRVLRAHLMEIRDAAFLPEGEMMRRSAHDSVYDMARDPYRYGLARILEAAEKSSNPNTSLTELLEMSESEHMGVRYWAACGLLGRADSLDPRLREGLQELLLDPNPVIASVAAEACLKIDPQDRPAVLQLLEITRRYLDREPTIALRSARALAESGRATQPFVEELLDLSRRLDGDVWGRYRNWLYPMFIGMSVDMALLNAGYELTLDR